ncbi:MAG: thiol reductase thioredoxin [bacterium]|nr:thiol reductase thioredoxin [bacterium]
MNHVKLKKKKKEHKMAEVKGVIHITDESFDTVTGNGVVLVDFWGPGCPPCVTQGPILEKVAKKLEGKAVISKINVQDHRQMASKYKISGIPTLLVFKDGEMVKQFVGLQGEDTLISTLQSHM